MLPGYAPRLPVFTRHVPRRHQGRSYTLTGAPSPVLAFHQGQELPDLGKQNYLFTSYPVLIPYLKETIYHLLQPPLYSLSLGVSAGMWRILWEKKDCQLEGGISGQGRYLKEGSMRPDRGGQMNIMFYGDQLNL